MGVPQHQPLAVAVAPSTPNHLKLYTEPSPEASAPRASLGGLPAVLAAFEQATGWSLQYTPTPQPCAKADLAWSTAVGPGEGVPGGLLSLHSARESATAPQLALGPASELASALAQLLGQSLRLEHALWQREAELATAVPLVSGPNQRRDLAERLQAVLKGAAEAVGCHAAGLYMLDEATSQLKLRACWGLPRTRLADPARPLRGSVADLEALLGSAVVLEHEAMAEPWKAPERFGSAVCVPVSSANTILGTLWVFCRQERTFDDHQTNIIEIVAGRLAAELEREVLLAEGIDSARWRSQLATAEHLQREQLPSLPPQIDGWQLSGWTEQAQGLGGDFFDWFCRPDGTAMVVIGDAAGRGPAAALVASALKAALRSHGLYHRQAERILAEVNQTIWSGSAGDQHGAALVALLEPRSGQISYSTAGPVRLLVLGGESSSPVAQLFPRLGEDPDSRFAPQQLHLQPGEVAILFTEGVYESPDAAGRPFGEAGIAAALEGHLPQPARELAERIRSFLARHLSEPAKDDRTVVVLKRPRP